MEYEPVMVRERYLSRIRPLYDSDLIKAIVGPRRAGKSMMLRMIRDDLGADDGRILYIDLEKMENDGLLDPGALHDRAASFMEGDGMYYLMFDEIQMVKGFERVLSSLRDSFRCSIFITGSNSRMLSGELSSLLTGRSMTFEILPFSYQESKEYLRMIGRPSPDDFMDDYLRRGGYPQRLQMPNDGLARSYLNELFDAILEKDIRRRYKRIDMGKFRKVASFVLANCGNDFSAESISDYLRKDGVSISAPTVNSYVDIMEQVYLIRRVNQYRISGKSIMSTKPKNYALDNGLRYIMTNSIDVQGGYYLENLVYLELIGRGYEVYVGRKYNGEIDFVAVRDGRKCFIQVAYLLIGQDTIAREFGAFASVRDPSPKYVMSLDRIDMSRDGITHINIPDFLEGKRDLYIS